MLNSLQTLGNLGGDPDVKYFESGSCLAKFTLYVNEKFNKGGEQQERTHRFPVEVWGKTAEYVANYLHQGSRVIVEGSLAEKTWIDGEQKRSRTFIKGQRITNLTPKSKSEPQGSAGDEEF